MLEGLLAFVIVAWMVERAYATRQWQKERRQLLNAALARTPYEQMAMDSADRPPRARRDEDDLIPEGFEHQAGV